MSMHNQKHGDGSLCEKMSIATSVLAQGGIMRKKHGDDS